MLKFVYLNTINIDHSNVKVLLSMADKYHIEDILRQCLQWMQEHVTAAAPPPRAALCGMGRRRVLE